MKRIVVSLSIGLLIRVLAGANAWAQATAEISGTVKNQTGVVTGAVITVTQIDTGIVRSTISDKRGWYTLSNLTIGRYRLETARQGSVGMCGPELRCKSTAVR